MNKNIKSDPLSVRQNHTRVPGFLLRLLRQKELIPARVLAYACRILQKKGW